MFHKGELLELASFHKNGVHPYEASPFLWKLALGVHPYETSPFLWKLASSRGSPYETSPFLWKLALGFHPYETS